MTDTEKKESFLDCVFSLLYRFRVNGSNDFKAIVWTQCFHSVSNEMNTQTFENVSVWTGPYGTLSKTAERRGQRQQNNKTNYTRQKVHVNMWNKADICAVLPQMRLKLLHFHAVFKTWPTSQELTSIVSFRGRGDAGDAGAKIETYRVTKVKICIIFSCATCKQKTCPIITRCYAWEFCRNFFFI